LLPGTKLFVAVLNQSDAAAFGATYAALAFTHFNLQQFGERLNASRDLLFI